MIGTIQQNLILASRHDLDGIVYRHDAWSDHLAIQREETVGALAFLISPIADNLTTSLIMGAVSLVVGRGRPKFVVVACINVVVAANAGGAFSPFGDITARFTCRRCWG